MLATRLFNYIFKLEASYEKPVFQIHSILSVLPFRIENFDVRGDKNFYKHRSQFKFKIAPNKYKPYSEDNQEGAYRGIYQAERFPYKYPRGFRAYGLKIDDYDKDQSWLTDSDRDQQWIVLYTTLGMTRDPAVKDGGEEQLLWTKILLSGRFENKICRSTNEVNGKGIILFDDPEAALQYANYIHIGKTELNKVILQVRADPDKVKLVNEGSTLQNPNIYLVNEQQYLRPYRFLIRNYMGNLFRVLV